MSRITLKALLPIASIAGAAYLGAVAATATLCLFVISCGGGGGGEVSPPPPPPTAQPQITWSVSSIEPILSPGENTARDVTFRSDRTFQNAAIEAIGSIATFVTISPSSIASVPAGQDQRVKLTLSIPAGTALGTVNGTIQVRSGGQAFSGVLSLKLNVWALFNDANQGVSLKLPPGLTLSDRQSDRTVFRKSGVNGYRLDVLSKSTPPSLSLTEWILRDWFKDPASASLETSPLTGIAAGRGERRDILVNGKSGVLLFSRSLGSQVTAFIREELTNRVIILKFWGEDLDQGEALESSLNELVGLVSTVRSI